MPHYVRPKKIYQYQVLDLLGKGGNGVVYKGIDMQNGTFVAIK
jgi:serine/threonine protein kinase